MQNDGNNSPVKAFLRNKWVRIILIINVLAVVFVAAFLIWNSTKTAIISINVSPTDAKIQLNGQGEYHNGSYKVHPGNYTVSINRDGFITKTFNLDLKSNYDTTLTTYLVDEKNDFSLYTLKDNYGSFQKLAQIASKGNNFTTDQDTSAEDFVEKFTQNLELYQNELPLLWGEWKMSDMGSQTEKYMSIEANYSSDCQKKLCFKATMAMMVDKDLAQNLLLSKGFDINYCEIKYEVN